MANFEISEPSVKSLFIEMRVNEQRLATGTGFIAPGPNGPLLITNRHNVTGRNQDTGKPLSSTGGIPDNVRIMHNQSGKLGWWTYRTEALLVGDEPRWREHPELGAKADFVALPLTHTDDIELNMYDPANPGPEICVRPSEIVSVVGFPFGLSGGGGLAIWATGFVASEPELPDDPTFLIDCRTRPGQSGSAVIAYRAGGAVTLERGNFFAGSGAMTRFLGIYSGRINAESDLGVVWKASEVAKLVASC